MITVLYMFKKLVGRLNILNKEMEDKIPKSKFRVGKLK